MPINYKTFLLIFSSTMLFVCCNQSKKVETAKTNHSTEKLPNIVLIVADDLGYGGISYYGNTYIQTPNLDFLAANGEVVSGNVDYHAHIDQEGYLDWWKGGEIKNEEGYSTDLINDYGANFIKEKNPEQTGKPFFLYLPHEAPHAPYQRRIDKILREVGKAGTTSVVTDSIPAIYKEMVEVMDGGIGKIVKTLKETEQFENTIIVFISDNGANQYGDNGALKGYKGSAYEGGSRVPAIFSYPGEISKGLVNNEVVFTMDLLPTLLDFIGEKPSAKIIDGISIKNSLLNQTPLPQRNVFLSHKDRSYIRAGDWKLVRIENEKKDLVELYNLSDDIAEKYNMSASRPDLVSELLVKLEVWEKEVNDGVQAIS